MRVRYEELSASEAQAFDMYRAGRISRAELERYPRAVVAIVRCPNCHVDGEPCYRHGGPA